MNNLLKLALENEFVCVFGDEAHQNAWSLVGKGLEYSHTRGEVSYFKASKELINNGNWETNGNQ